MRIEVLQRFFLDSFMTLKGTVSLFSNPTNTQSVYDIEDGLRHDKSTFLSIEYIKSQPGVMDIVCDRYLAPVPNFDALSKCSPYSLGYAYAAYIRDNGFDPMFYRTLTVDDDTSYIFQRRRQTHDIWHIVTGLGIDEASELGLKAFELAQTRSTMSALLVAGGLVRTLLKAPEQLGYLLDRIAVGYRMGMKAKPFLAQRWEDHWEKPVAQWREELSVQIPSVYMP